MFGNIKKMIQELSIKIANFMVKRSIISDSDRNLYEFAYLSLIERLISWGTIIVLGTLFDCFLGSIIFTFSFVPLRIYAGGFHAKVYWKCFLISSITFLIVIVFFKNIYSHISTEIILFFLFISIIIIIKKAPISDPNRPLNKKEFQNYKLVTRKILLIETIMIIPTSIYNIHNIFPAFTIMAIILESFLLVINFNKTKHPKSDN